MFTFISCYNKQRRISNFKAELSFFSLSSPGVGTLCWILLSNVARLQLRNEPHLMQCITHIPVQWFSVALCGAAALLSVERLLFVLWKVWLCV